ncbi:MAG: 4Fe-4S binding protein, partial [Chloroflexi bacterium]|nr:4Fe-4S binding protein [Chloroflexota bacterium]
YKVARETGMSRRVNTVMQTCFFALSGVLPKDEAIAAIKQAIRKSYGKRGETVVQQNFAAVDQALAHLYEVHVPALATSHTLLRTPVAPAAPGFVQEVTAMMIAGRGDELPVSAMPPGGTFPLGTAQWEKRNLALEIPVWDPERCIQCGKCVLVCPHAAIREKVYPTPALEGAPETFKSAPARWRAFAGDLYTLQTAPEDCTGCALCFEACPVVSKSDPARRAINLAPQPPLRESESANFDFFLQLPEVDRTKLNLSLVKDSQLCQPLFEFSGACSGCGETPYLKLLTQLFGDHVVIANATGCSSIFGGNLPTTPWAHNRDGRGPAWANSLFEDNAEFGLGFRLSIDHQAAYARDLLARLRSELDDALVDGLLGAGQATDAGIQAQRARVRELKAALQRSDLPVARELLSVADALVKRSVWLVGGDGWAYDIGYGGLDHVLASGANVNVLVLDTEVYSNTGGQMSKATPRGAVTRFAAGGKALPKKDLALLAMTYGHIYVARVAMGANDSQTIRTFLEAEAYDGPSLIIAYAHCIEHGLDLRLGLGQQKNAVASGYWPLFRYNPALAQQGKNPFTLDSKAPSIPLAQYAYAEDRYKMLVQRDRAEAGRLMELAQRDVENRWRQYQDLAQFFAATSHANGKADGKLAP